MIIIKNIIILCFLFLSFLLSAQEVEFNVSAPPVVENGQRFSLVYSLNAEGSDFKAPAFEDFRYLSGPNTSSSSSIQIIDGKMSRSVNYSYTFYLQATAEGEFRIPPASVTVDGKEYESEALTIKVVKGSGNTAQPGTGSPQTRQNKPSTGQISDNDIFIRAIANKSNPYQGEEILVTYKLYTKVAARSPMISKSPSFPGFWSVDIMERDQRISQSREIYNGEQYITAVLDKAALFAQKSGKLTIEPMELDIDIQVQTQRRRNVDSFFDQFFDDPFFSGVDYIKKTLKSNKLEIDVKPLPLQNRPAHYTGAVGNLKLNSSLDKKELKTNEPITFKISISGRGNLDLIEEPKINFPPDFEVYDPKISSNINKNINGVSGVVNFEYLMIPRNPGNFRIDPVNFSYFDLSKEKYVRLSTPAYDITVEKGEAVAGNLQYSGVSQEEVQYIGSDIRHIKTGQIKLQRMNSYFFNSPLFWLLVLLPLILAFFIIMYWKSREKKKQDIRFMKYKKATRVARKNLKKAKEYLEKKNKEAFYVEISQALWGYLGNKFNIPRSRLSMETVHQSLSGEAIEADTIDEFIDTLKATEYARFAPGDAEERMDDIYRQALNMISKIERELK